MKLAKIEYIGIVYLKLYSGHVLILGDTIYVPSISRNLIYVSTLDSSSYSFHFGNKGII